MDTLFLAYLRNYKGFMENFRKTGTSGTIATFNALANTQIKNLEIEINAKQEGTGDPSPDNIRPITGWSQAKITRCGKNLWNGAHTGETINSTTGEVKTTGNTDWMADAIAIGDDKKITFTITDKSTYTSGSINYAGYDADGNYVTHASFASTNNITVPYTITVTLGSNVAKIIPYGYHSGGATGITTATIQIEHGATATSLEPYNGNTYTIDLDGTRYGGTLDVTTGVLTLTHKCIDMNTLTWTMPTEGGFASSAISETAKGRDLDLISSVFVYDNRYSFSWGNFSAYDDNTIYRNNNYTYLYVKCTSCTTLEAFTTLIDGQMLVYELATPQTVTLTPTQIFALQGVNNMWADCGDIISFDYYGES